jgi:two-component system KDP operon response regulator KdpE
VSIGTPAEPASRPRVLVVDDEPQIVRALKWCCARRASRRCRRNGRGGARPRRGAPAGAAIVDLVLPDGDGIEVTRTLREWSEMPILVLSAVGEEEQKVRALEAGADDYITKPFGARELVAGCRRRCAARRDPGGADDRGVEASRSTSPRGSCAATASRST